jgi:hypothetical protein
VRGGALRASAAGAIGGIPAAGGGYFVLKQGIPGISLPDPHSRQKIVQLEERMASLELASRGQSRPGGGNVYQPSSGAEGVNELRSRLDGIVEVTRGLDQSVLALTQKVQALEAHPGGGGESRENLRAEIAAQTAALQQRLASAERELDGLTRAQTERLADARTASLTLALTNLKRAVADGRPFPAELAAVEPWWQLPVSQLGRTRTLALRRCRAPDGFRRVLKDRRSPLRRRPAAYGRHALARRVAQTAHR